MHQLLMGNKPGLVIDHINGNGLDNRRSNLRYATFTENARNAASSKNGSVAYKGVCQVQGGKYQASIGLGTFTDPEEAARAYDHAAKLIHGEFARLNFPELACV